MKSRFTVLVISFSELKRDPRVYRQLLFLSRFSHLDVYAAGFNDPEIPNINFIKVSQRKEDGYFQKILGAIWLKAGLFEKYYQSSSPIQYASSKFYGIAADIIISNDLNSLPLAVFLSKANNSKIYLDAHEYTPRQFEDRWIFRFFFRSYWDYMAKKYLPEVDVMTTVCNALSQEYKKVYGVRSSIITNAPFYSSLEPRKIDPDVIRMVHHGISGRSRKLENMIFLMDLLDERFHLDFMLVSSDNEYYEWLKKLAKKNCRIRFREPVPMLEISSAVNRYDIGLCLLSPSSFNCAMSLPNKLFEFIQGRVAVASWPSIEIKAVVEQYSCGVCSQEFTIESMADILNQLKSSQIQFYKDNSHKAAAELCAEKNFEIMDNILSDLLR